jgi:Na+/melibiose symporter-like transporter
MIRRALPWVIIGPAVFAVLAVLVFLLLALSLGGRR